MPAPAAMPAASKSSSARSRSWSKRSAKRKRKRPSLSRKASPQKARLPPRRPPPRNLRPKRPRRKLPNGSESQSDRTAPRRQPYLGLALVRGQEGIRQAAAGGHQDPRLSQRQTEGRRRLPHRDRAPAQEVSRNHPFGPSGGGDRQEGRRHREAEERRSEVHR